MQNKVKYLKREKKRQKQYSYFEDKTVLFHAAGCDDQCSLLREKGVILPHVL